jgi:hypothetical protein
MRELLWKRKTKVRFWTKLALVGLLISLLCGCSDNKQESGAQGGTEGAGQEEMQDKNLLYGDVNSDGNSDGNSDENAQTENATGTEMVDLTALSSTMVYGEVFNMMMQPESYMGKTVKMKGKFAVYTDETTGSRYYTCIIKDATACCAKGIEFELSGDYDYPEDYPEEGITILVQGTFDVYEEGGKKFCTLRNASMDVC